MREQAEKLLEAWVRLTGILKNTRITKGLMYNEAVIMLILYRRYKKDGVGLVAVKEIVQETKMLKSLVNRTINSLEEKGLLKRLGGAEDKRTIYVKCIEDRLDTFLQVHNSSLTVSESIIDIIGKEDADAFIRIADKIYSAGYKL